MRKKHVGEAAVLLCILAVLCCFVFQKEGYHIDELLSMELSNAEYNPWIVSTQPVGRLKKFVEQEIIGESFGETFVNLVVRTWDLLRNGEESMALQYQADVYPEPVWITAKQFRDYLTVDREDCFNYLSVYFNVKDDNHPPFHYMLLHTISSVFQGSLSPLPGCAINLLAIAGCIICFFRLGAVLEKGGVIPEGSGRTAGICMGLLYGLSAGAIATTLLIRMYGTMTFMCVALFYLHVKKWLEKGFERKNAKLTLVTVLGFWTQYFFLFYCLALAGVTAGLLIVKKRYRECRGYVGSMILAAVIGLAVFPYAVEDIFSSGRGMEALQNLGNGFDGYGIRLGAFGTIFMEACFGGVLLGVFVAGCGAAGLLFAWLRGRKGKVSSQQMQGTEQAAGLARQGENERVADPARTEGKEGFCIWLMLLVPCCCYFLLAARMSPYLVDRYVMPVFPFAAVIMTLVLARIFAVFPGVSFCWMLLPALLLGVANVAGYDGHYLYKGYERQYELAKAYAEFPCICMYDGQGYYYNLMEFTEYRETLLLHIWELEGRADTADLEQRDQVVVLRKSIVDEAAVLEALRKYGWEVEEVLLEAEESVYGDTVYLCGKVQGF